MTATTNSSGCRSRRYSPIPPTCAPRLSWPRPNAPTPGTAPRLRRSTGLAAAPRDATGRARGHARTHRGDRKQLRSLTPCPRSATEPVLVRLRHLAVAATTRRVLRRCVAPSPRDHDHRLIAGHSGRSCPIGDCRWSATRHDFSVPHRVQEKDRAGRLMGTPQQPDVADRERSPGAGGARSLPRLGFGPGCRARSRRGFPHGGRPAGGADERRPAACTSSTVRRVCCTLRSLMRRRASTRWSRSW